MPPERLASDRPLTVSPSPTGNSPRSIFLRFLKFGLLAWGGPAAQIAMIKHECVDEEGWVSEETFKKALAVYQVLPGPEAHELCVYSGGCAAASSAASSPGLASCCPASSSLHRGRQRGRRPHPVLAIGAFLALDRWHGKLTVLYVVFGCGLIGAALQLTML